jgi:penicillin-binding protein 1C
LRLEPGAPAAPDRRVFSPEAAFLVTDILSDRASRAPSFGLESALSARVWSAAKTGTSVDMRDNWCAGITRRYTVAVWLGNFSGKPMHDVTGVDGAAPAWLEIVHALHAGDAPRSAAASPAPPPGVTRAGNEWFLAGTQPSGATAERVPAPTATLSLARIISPQPGARIALDPDIPDTHERLLFEAAPRDPRVAFHLDGRPLGHASDPILWQPTRGRHRLALVSPDGAVVNVVEFAVR